MTRVELLAPAKNFKALRAATSAGADAVYFGVEVLNMRVRADNFKTEDLPRVVEACHEAGARAYLATNVIVYDRELELLGGIVGAARSAGVDAVIVHDVGAIELAKDAGLEFHVSTQANISNVLSAKFYGELGARRLILARELSLEQITNLKSEVDPLEIEVFVHGAMCTSISGRCYFSADVCGSAEFSANRGKCIQPCRRMYRVIDEENNEYIYDGQMFLNAKDLCMIEHVPELVEAGIDAFKIEGRMRDPYYVETVTRCYREAIDAHHDGTFTSERVAGWLADLRRVYNRGFTTGFYFGRPTETDVEHDIRGNVSEYHRVEVGRVQDYYKKARAAKVLVTRGTLRVGDEIIVEGVHSDTYFRQRVRSLQVKQKQVTETPLASSRNNVLVGMLVDHPVKKNDRVYLFRKRK
ncbi:MAG: peptidase U32 family protein [Promethearchaeota archaeon]